MKTASERASEENEAKLQRNEEDRLAAFEAGLKMLPDLEFDEVDGDPNKMLSDFRTDSRAELKAILAKAEQQQTSPKEIRRAHADKEDHN